MEGSGVDDCKEDVYCCEQSICDLKVNPDRNEDKRCCTREEMKSDPPWLCTLCKECCDEEERNQEPKLEFCSKCKRCDPSKLHILIAKIKRKISNIKWQKSKHTISNFDIILDRLRSGLNISNGNTVETTATSIPTSGKYLSKVI